MKQLIFSFLAAISLLSLSSASRVGSLPYGALHIINIPAVAHDVDITFTQAGATTLNLLGSQVGFSHGDGHVSIPASAAAQHFSNAGFDPQDPVGIKVGLLDETGDAITNPGTVTGSFTMNPNGPTVINYAGL